PADPALEGGLSGDSFALMIINCVERLRVRREQRKTIDLIGRMHKNLTFWFDLDKQLDVVVKFPRQINPKIHKASIRMQRSGLGSDEEPGLERVAYAGCYACTSGRCRGGPESPVQDKGIVAHVFRKGASYWRNEAIDKDPYYVETCPSTRSELCVPLKIGE